MAKLGSSDIDVLPIGLGANTFGWTADRETSYGVIDAFLAGGGSLIDTADAYTAWLPGHSGGESETIIGEWFTKTGRRKDVVLATKVSQHPEFLGLSADNIAAAAQASLGRLQTDYIDIYFAHRDFPETPMEETITAFAQLVSRGDVRYIGLSNYSAERIDEWTATCERLGVDKPVTLQPNYSLLAREDFERDLQPAAAEHELGVLPYFSLASGFLTGKYQSVEDVKGAARERLLGSYLTDSGFAVAREVVAIAGELDTEPAAVALAWLRDQPTVTAPLASASTIAQVTPLLDAARLPLSSEHLSRLNQVSSAFSPA